MIVNDNFKVQCEACFSSTAACVCFELNQPERHWSSRGGLFVMKLPYCDSNRFSVQLTLVNSLCDGFLLGQSETTLTLDDSF